ncbi:hypothetical protein HU200_053620 [Digitaria exilis]|uniref:FBD domain-containing protein n=1 Tax=Digitaria exilis TaxID=1010633 RepID=A0A835AP51_9POAL|nr:hypothetical protein HU200_053620 [Digitaria exilis]
MMLGCPCHLPESYRADNITFDALEEIDIDNFTGSSEHKKFVIILLSRCNAATLKSLEITMSGEFIPSKIKGVCKEINSVCQPNCKVKFNVVGEMGLEPFVF